MRLVPAQGGSAGAHRTWGGKPRSQWACGGPGSGQRVGAGGTLFHGEEEQGRPLSPPSSSRRDQGAADEAPDAGSECQSEGSQDTRDGWVLTWL